ncbi:MAG TPA: DUF1573 domain-containing protein [Bacteroidetes bacterium]|nr:DUF1573 domain-containing protein [Bacteroidota bacterium]
MDNRELWNYLTTAARDVGEDGQDNLFGYGLLHIDPDFEVEEPRIRVEPDELSFEIEGMEVEQDAGLTVSNVGNRTLIFETEVDIIAEPDDAPDWISWEPREGEVEPDEHTVITVTVNATDAVEGNYEAELHILSNDPGDQDTVIPVAMRVLGFADIWVDWSEEAGYPDIMDWSMVYEAMEINEDYDLPFIIYNRGRTDLIVETIEVDGDNFTVDLDSLIIPHDESRDVTVTFRSDMPGDYEAAILVVSNDFDHWEWEIPLHAEIANHPPRAVGFIEDQELDEDFETYNVVDLEEIFDDPDGQPLTYSAQIDNPIVSAEIDDEDILSLEAVPNLHGTASIVVVADDRSGGAAGDTFQVTISPVNDPPTQFNLVSPEDNSTFCDNPDVPFIWEVSVDEVEDSTVSYALILEYNDEQYRHTGINDTVFLVSREEFSVDPHVETDVTWRVLASDGTDTIRSAGDDFHVIVAPLTVDDEDSPLPTELILGPVHPNPFNEFVSIDFAMPNPTAAKLTVYDPRGRRIRTLANGQMSAGRHRLLWDGLDQNGMKASSGLYICRLATPDGILLQRLVLLR